MMRSLAAYPRIRTIMWFDYDKESDWRIDSTARSATAFSRGLPAFLAG